MHRKAELHEFYIVFHTVPPLYFFLIGWIQLKYILKLFYIVVIYLSSNLFIHSTSDSML